MFQPHPRLQEMLPATGKSSAPCRHPVSQQPLPEDPHPVPGLRSQPESSAPLPPPGISTQQQQQPESRSTLRPGPRPPLHQEAGGGTCAQEGEKSAGGERRMEMGNRRGAHSYCLPVGHHREKREPGSSCQQPSGTPPAGRRPWQQRPRARGPEEQPQEQAGHGARLCQTAPMGHRSTEASNHPVSGPSLQMSKLRSGRRSHLRDLHSKEEPE